MPASHISRTLHQLAAHCPPLTQAQHASLIGVSVDVYRSWMRFGSPVLVDLDRIREYLHPADSPIKPGPLCCRLADAYRRIPCMKTLTCSHIRLSCGLLPHGVSLWAEGNFGRSEHLNGSLSCPTDNHCRAPFSCDYGTPELDILEILQAGDEIGI